MMMQLQMSKKILNRHVKPLYPYSDYGCIHSLVDMYVEHQDDKYDVESGKVVEALAELMDREYSK